MIKFRLVLLVVLFAGLLLADTAPADPNTPVDPDNLPWFEAFGGDEGSFDPDWIPYAVSFFGGLSGQDSEIFQGGWHIKGAGATFDVTVVTGVDLGTFTAGVTIKDMKGHQGIVFNALPNANYKTFECGWDFTDTRSGVYFTAQRWGFSDWSDGLKHHQTGETIRMWVRVVEGHLFWEGYAEVLGTDPLVWAYTSLSEAGIDGFSGGYNETNGGVGLINLYNHASPFDDFSLGAAYFPVPFGSGVVIEETGGGTEVNEEGPTSDIYTVRLINDPNGQTVTVALSPDGQVNTDVTQLTFTSADYTDWNDRKTITVTAVNDLDAEASPHPGVITHTVTSDNPGDTVWNTPPSDLTANVLDNDELAIACRETGGSTDVAEEGQTTDTYEVKLGQLPSGEVTVTLTTDDDVDTDLPQLIFNTGNWSDWQQVTVMAQEDGLSEGPEVSLVLHQASGGGYDGVSKDQPVNVTDNEAYCGDGTHGYLITDVNLDCYVDEKDLSILGALWLSCSDPFSPGSCTLIP